MNSPSLEQRLARIQAICSMLESDNLDLEQALQLFEEGVAHLREAEVTLRQAELRVERLLAGPGGTIELEQLGEES